MSSEIEKLQLEISLLQQIIIRNQRLWLTGSMMGNLIHDLNNPLTSINGNVELLQINPVTEDPKIKKRVDTIQNGVKRLTHKLRDMQLFTKEGKGETFVDINQICEETARVAEYLPKPSKLPITTNLSNQALACTCNPNQLAQAILAIMDNALDSALSVSNPKVSISTEQQNSKVLIKITNNGQMIDAALGEKIFEPFFSTKEDCLGIGLSFAKQAILAHSGEITYGSTPEETFFLITLPCNV